MAQDDLIQQFVTPGGSFSALLPVTELEWIKWTFWVVAAGSAGSIIYLGRELISPRLRQKRLRYRAVDARWCITKAENYSLRYAIQDDDEHEILDLFLPSQTTDLFIHILLRPRLSFRQTAAEFGFEQGLIQHKPPIIQYWFHPFVARGQREKHPDPDSPNYDRDHYVDYHGNYHINTPAIWPKNETITYGFKVDTQEVGEYRLKISIVADGIPSSYLLALHVEPSFSREVPCIAKPHRNCFIRLKHSAR